MGVVEHAPKGECVLVRVDAKKEELEEEERRRWEDMTLEEHMDLSEPGTEKKRKR